MNVVYIDNVVNADDVVAIVVASPFLVGAGASFEGEETTIA